ncbi:MAG: hypothetical protein MJ175_06945, partial [Clostridia bacterium]|nr:hypothetical protein [Clostridia bacterium]
MKKSTLAIASLLLLAQLTACGEAAVSDNGGKDTAAPDQPKVTEAVTEAVPEYNYPAEGFGGEEFSILNINDIWSMHSIILRETETGDVLDDAL